MQNLIITKPYRFVPPARSTVWPRLLQPWLPQLQRSRGVTSVEIHGLERLHASVEAGHGIMLTPNHCRPGDPFVVGALGFAVDRPVHIMASWHLFMQSWLQTFLLSRAGVFSIYREGMDREALKCAIQILAEARRPLVVFPEGVISRHNDRLNNLMEGTALMCRSAAKQRAAASPAGKVVVHPVAVRYIFEGDLDETAQPILERIEHRLAWRPQRDLSLVDRVVKIGGALLALKEIEYFGAPQSGDLSERVQRLIDRVLGPLEEEWLKGRREKDVVGRVKALRIAILPDMIGDQLSEGERERRWRHFADVYFAQQLAFYPAGYLSGSPTPERVLETIERFEEDLTDKVRVVSPLRARVDVGTAIEVTPDRPRGGSGDPLMASIRENIEAMLAASLAETRQGATLS
jgi:1-acyl-sn-glycerol-3-phosphate acyltransferase